MKTISCAERDSSRQGGTKRSSEYNRDLRSVEMNNRQLTVNCHVAFNTRPTLVPATSGRFRQHSNGPLAHSYQTVAYHHG